MPSAILRKTSSPSSPMNKAGKILLTEKRLGVGRGDLFTDRSVKTKLSFPCLATVDGVEATENWDVDRLQLLRLMHGLKEDSARLLAALKAEYGRQCEAAR